MTLIVLAGLLNSKPNQWKFFFFFYIYFCIITAAYLHTRNTVLCKDNRKEIFRRWVRRYRLGGVEDGCQLKQDKIFRRKRLSTGVNFVHVYIEIWDKVYSNLFNFSIPKDK